MYQVRERVPVLMDMTQAQSEAAYGHPTPADNWMRPMKWDHFSLLPSLASRSFVDPGRALLVEEARQIKRTLKAAGVPVKVSRRRAA